MQRSGMIRVPSVCMICLRTSPVVSACLALPAIAGVAQAQFGTPPSSTHRERVVGQIVASDGAPVPEGGDQIGAFFGTTLVGKFVYSGSGTVTRDYDIAINGDIPGTTAKEGPAVGDKVTFRFFDSSTNNTLPLTVLNSRGEAFSYRFNGSQVIDIPGLPIDLTPSVSLNMRIGADPNDGGNNGGGNGNTNKYDINGDGKVNEEDSAAILRRVSGGTASAPSTRTPSTTNTTSSQSSTSSTTQTTDSTNSETTATVSMDVNGDGKIDVNDAIEVLRNQSK